MSLQIVVLIPSYNQKNEVEKRVAEFERDRELSSEKFEWNLVIGDDGSLDGTSNYLKSLESIEYISSVCLKKNQGRVAMRNALIAKQKEVFPSTQYVLFLDGDVSLANGLLSSWEEYLEGLKKSSIEKVILGRVIYPKFSGFCSYLQSGSGPFRFEGQGPFEAKYITTGHLMLHNSIFGKVNGFDTDFKKWGGEDWAFGLELARKGIQIYTNPRAVVYHPKQDVKEWVLRSCEFGKEQFPLIQSKYPEAQGFGSETVTGIRGKILRLIIQNFPLRLWATLLSVMDRFYLPHLVYQMAVFVAVNKKR
jgi:GT2 family glycosyltransferase